MVAVQASIQAIKTQLKLYESLNGFTPTTEQGLKALVTQPGSEPVPTRWTQLLDRPLATSVNGPSRTPCPTQVSYRIDRKSVV